VPRFAAVDPVRAMVAYLALESARALAPAYLVFAIGPGRVLPALHGVLTGRNAPANPAERLLSSSRWWPTGMIGASLSNAIPIQPGAGERLDPPAPDHAASRLGLDRDKLVIAYLTSLPRWSSSASLPSRSTT
jgi:hypothetical protein